ncbi:hypothetical protein [Microbacterium sp.]|uniref:hypothetical protein n=1 Tax=Microbacterium sp. TaxID=51671 RepID=UPI003A8C5163
MTTDRATESASSLSGQVADLVAGLTSLADEVVEQRKGAEIDDAVIADVLAVSARLFQAKTDRVGKRPWPIRPDQLTATETVVLVNALLDAADVNLFDMAIWYRRAE